MRIIRSCISIVALVLTGVLVVKYYQRHSLKYAIDHARVITITLPDNQTTYYLSKQRNPVIFSEFKHLLIEGVNYYSPPITNICMVTVYVDDGNYYASDELAIKKIQGVRAIYSVKHELLYQYPTDYGWIPFDGSRFMVDHNFSDWMRTKVPINNAEQNAIIKSSENPGNIPSKKDIKSMTIQHIDASGVKIHAGPMK